MAESNSEDEIDSISITNSPEIVLSTQSDMYIHLQRQALSMIRIIVAALALIAVVTINERAFTIMMEIYDTGIVDLEEVASDFPFGESRAEDIIDMMITNGLLYILYGANIFILSLVLFSRIVKSRDLKPGLEEESEFITINDGDLGNISDPSISDWINANTEQISEMKNNQSRGFISLSLAMSFILIGIMFIMVSGLARFHLLFFMSIVGVGCILVMVVGFGYEIYSYGFRDFIEDDTNFYHYAFLLPLIPLTLFIFYISLLFCVYWTGNIELLPSKNWIQITILTR